MPLPEEKTRYTYADYLTWDENERIEIIDGEAVMMATPTPTHQEISMEISRQLANFLKGKPCKVYAAPFTVRLFEKDDDKPENIYTVVEPDISVICDQNKIDNRGCKGAPDLIIEILSPSTSRHDCFIKLNLYLQAGVREYWIVDPQSNSVQVFLLDNGMFRVAKAYDLNDIAKVNVLNGCTIDLSEVFPAPTDS